MSIKNPLGKRGFFENDSGMDELGGKVTYSISIYAKVHKEQINSIWHTKLVLMTREEVRTFDGQKNNQKLHWLEHV